MRQTAARLNRTWLIIIGLILLLAGAAGALIGTGLSSSAAQAAGLGFTGPGSSDQLIGTGTAAAFQSAWVVLLVAVVGIILALLGLGWLIAQIPRANAAKPLRLHDDPGTGLTRCAPSVITAAVEEQVRDLPGVQAASAVLRGSAATPDLTIKITADDRTDLPRLIAAVQNDIAGDLTASLETPLERLGIQIEVATAQSRTNAITV